MGISQVQLPDYTRASALAQLGHAASPVSRIETGQEAQGQSLPEDQLC